MSDRFPRRATLEDLVVACRPSLNGDTINALEQFAEDAHKQSCAAQVLGDDRDFDEERMVLTAELFLISFYRNIKRVMAALDERETP